MTSSKLEMLDWYWSVLFSIIQNELLSLNKWMKPQLWISKDLWFFHVHSYHTYHVREKCVLSFIMAFLCFWKLFSYKSKLQIFTKSQIFVSCRLNLGKNTLYYAVHSTQFLLSNDRPWDLAEKCILKVIQLQSKAEFESLIFLPMLYFTHALLVCSFPHSLSNGITHIKSVLKSARPKMYKRQKGRMDLTFS